MFVAPGRMEEDILTMERAGALCLQFRHSAPIKDKEEMERSLSQGRSNK
jgi:hypothetical protein